MSENESIESTEIPVPSGLVEPPVEAGPKYSSNSLVNKAKDTLLVLYFENDLLHDIAVFSHCNEVVEFKKLLKGKPLAEAKAALEKIWAGWTDDDATSFNPILALHAFNLWKSEDAVRKSKSFPYAAMFEQHTNTWWEYSTASKHDCDFLSHAKTVIALKDDVDAWKKGLNGKW